MKEFNETSKEFEDIIDKWNAIGCTSFSNIPAAKYEEYLKKCVKEFDHDKADEEYKTLIGKTIKNVSQITNTIIHIEFEDGSQADIHNEGVEHEDVCIVINEW